MPFIDGRKGRDDLHIKLKIPERNAQELYGAVFLSTELFFNAAVMEHHPTH